MEFYGRMESDKFVVCIPASLCDINSIINKMDMTLNSANIVDYNLKIFAGIYNIINDEKNTNRPDVRPCQYGA